MHEQSTDRPRRRKDYLMGYYPEAVLTFGWDLPEDFKASWMEHDWESAEDAARRVIRMVNEVSQAHVIRKPGGSLRLIVRYFQADGGRVNSPTGIMEDDLLVSEVDHVHLVSAADALGIDPKTLGKPHWLLTAAVN